MTQQAFANALGIPPSTISGIFGGRSNPTQNTVLAVHRTFPKINVNWLMFGEGDMYDGMSDGNAGQGDGSAVPPVADAVASPVAAVRTEAVAGQVQIKYVERQPRKVTEIRVFFDDGTYETFYPKIKE